MIIVRYIKHALKLTALKNCFFEIKKVKKTK